jgi:putative phosphoesterase
VHVLVLSDTHLSSTSLHRMPAEVWDLAAASDVVLHAGDVTDPAVLAALAERAEVHAVLGNNDHGVELPGVLVRRLGGVEVAMVHDSGPRAGRAARMARTFPMARVVVFGHSHEPVLEETEHGQLLVNPGSPTQRRRQPVHTVALLELEAGEVRRAEVRPVGPLAAGSGSARGPRD